MEEMKEGTKERKKEERKERRKEVRIALSAFYTTHGDDQNILCKGITTHRGHLFIFLKKKI